MFLHLVPKNSAILFIVVTLFTEVCFMGEEIVDEVCEKKEMSLNCIYGEEIRIIAAAYGLYSSKNSCDAKYRPNCVDEVRALQVLKRRCNGQDTCFFKADNDHFGDPCRGSKNYLRLIWECVKLPGADVNCIHDGDPKGLNYRGTTNVTKSGRKCQRWEDQFPNEHKALPEKYPDLGLTSNYCRNPSRFSRPWCYNGEGEDPRWEYCDLKLCYTSVKQLEACHEKQMIVECPLGKKIVILKAAYGIYSNANSCGYKQKNGKCVSDMTLEIRCNGFRSCNLKAHPDFFGKPCESSKMYLLVAWTCHAVSQTELCIMEKDPKGKLYRGEKDKTALGETCQKWSSQTPNAHSYTPTNYPEAGLEENYCRNPSGGEGSTPWCYTADKQGWGRCDISNCSLADSTTHTKETCEKDEMAIFCDPPYIVEIKYAFWGVYANLNACDTKYDGPGKCNDPNSKNIVRRVCPYGVSQCTVKAKNRDLVFNWMFEDRCEGTKKYLRVTWDCKKSPECYDSYDPTGKNYRGTRAVSKSGVCQSWSQQTPNVHQFHPENYPDAGLESNYCRNPNGAEFPWCFNGKGTDPVWDYCRIKECSTTTINFKRWNYVDTEPQRSFYPYHTSILISVYERDYFRDKVYHCVLFSEEHRCPNRDYFRFEFLYDRDADRIKFRWLMRYGPLVSDDMPLDEDWTDSGTDFINSLADLKIPYEPRKIESLAVEITYHSMLVLVDYKPIKEYILNGDVFPYEPGRIGSRGHLNLEKCRAIQVKSNCMQVPCRFYTAHQFHDNFPPGVRIDTLCMNFYLPQCNTGYCHNGRCAKTDFQHDVCSCEDKKTMGEYCSIRDKDEVEQIVRWSQGYEIEVDFHKDKIDVDLVPNFKDWSWRYYFIRFYKIEYRDGEILQTLVHAAQSPKTPTGAGYTFVMPGALSNTTYLISSFGRSDLDRGNLIGQSFVHSVEVHTPGYAFLPPPRNLTIHSEPGHMFRLSWEYEHEIPASEFLINITSSSGVEQEVADMNHQTLTLRSDTVYTITVMTLNAIGDYNEASQPLQFKTPVFQYDNKNHGHYDFAKWFFKVNSINMDHWFVYFKSPVRRDIRVKRVALLCNYSVESPPTPEANADFSAIYHAARFNQSYYNHTLFSPYVAASFTTTPLPRRLQIGDRGYYEKYFNGALEKEYVYQVYVIVWYVSGKTLDVSVQYLGEIEQSKVPWVIIFVSVALSALALTVLTAALNCCFYKYMIAHQHKKVKMLQGSLSVKSLMVESLYMNEILSNPDYDMTEGKQNSKTTVQYSDDNDRDSDTDSDDSEARSTSESENDDKARLIKNRISGSSVARKRR